MIEGTLIDLRAVEEDDAIVFHRWFNDPQVTRLIGSNAFPALSLAQERAFLQGLRDDQSRRAFSILLKDGTLIGTCMLRNFNWTARSCEVGITIGEQQHWGRRYGGETLQLMQRLVFDELNLHKLWLTCAAYNERGLRAYRRIGFREDGRLRDDRFLDGRYHDTVVMSILEDEWRSLNMQSAEAEPTNGKAELPVVGLVAETTEGVAEPPVGEPTIATPERAAQALAPAEEPAAQGVATETAAPDASTETAEQRPSGFNFTLQKTYYQSGFFNVPAEADAQVGAAEGPITLVLEGVEQPIPARLDRKANPNGTARIFGGVKLRGWFRSRFNLMDVVRVEIEAPDLLRLRQAAM